jgi:hypothetical protein
MAEAEQPERLRGERPITVDDIRGLTAASTPHFALQLRNRVRKLIGGLAADDPVRVEGERAIARLEQIAYTGETRGGAHEEPLRPLPSLNDHAVGPAS